MGTYHSKRGPVEGCPQPDEPIRERAWTEGQKADMHREAFEKWFDVEHVESFAAWLRARRTPEQPE
jgi:hypothetical protein